MVTDQETNIVLGKIQRRDELQIIVAHKTYKNNPFIDLREYYKNKKDGNYTHTQSGFTLAFNSDAIDELIEILNTAKKYIEDIETKQQEVKERNINDNKRKRNEEWESKQQQQSSQQQETQSSRLGL
jgi:hypothetical protein